MRGALPTSPPLLASAAFPGSPNLLGSLVPSFHQPPPFRRRFGEPCHSCQSTWMKNAVDSEGTKGRLLMFSQTSSPLVSSLPARTSPPIHRFRRGVTFLPSLPNPTSRLIFPQLGGKASRIALRTADCGTSSIVSQRSPDPSAACLPRRDDCAAAARTTGFQRLSAR